MLRLPALLLLCATPLACLAAPAAQTVIHHCVDANGTPVFTDQPCASMDAIPATSQTNPFNPGRPTGPRACPRDRETLEKRVAEAFRSHNVNALAGLMLWRGYAQFGAVHTVRDLANLMQWPFLGFAGTSPTTARSSPARTMPLPWIPAPAQTTAAATSPDVLTIKLGRPRQPEVSFAVARRVGCLWLEP